MEGLLKEILAVLKRIEGELKKMNTPGITFPPYPNPYDPDDYKPMNEDSSTWRPPCTTITFCTCKDGEECNMCGYKDRC